MTGSQTQGVEFRELNSGSQTQLNSKNSESLPVSTRGELTASNSFECKRRETGRRAAVHVRLTLSKIKPQSVFAALSQVSQVEARFSLKHSGSVS